MAGSSLQHPPGSARVATRDAHSPLLGTGRQWLAPVVLATIITLLVARLSVSLSLTEYAVLDAWMRVRPPLEPVAPVALVGITRDDIERYTDTRPAECACELVPRSRIGKAVAALKRSGAKVVALDLMISQACTIGKGTPWSHDGPLTAALETPGPVVIAGTAAATAGHVRLHPPPAQVLGDSDVVIASPVLVNPHGVIRGVELMQYESPSTQMEQTLGETVIPIGEGHLSICAACIAACCDRPDPEPLRLTPSYSRFCGLRYTVRNAESIRLQDALLPGGWRRRPGDVMLINWAGPTGTFPLYPLGSVLSENPSVLRQWFDGKIVLLGSLEDRGITPLRGMTVASARPLVDEASELTMSGIEIHANAINTLYSERSIRTWSSEAVLCLVFGTSLLTFAAFRLTGIWQALGAAIVMIAAMFSASWVVFSRFDLWLYAVMPSAAIAVSGVTGAVDAYLHARQEATEARGKLKARDLVTRTIAHDLKQPLAAISALAAALRAQQATGTISPMLIDKIDGQARRAMGDINELLAVDPNRPLTLRCEVFDVAGLVEDLATTYSLRSTAHDVALSRPDGPVQVEADPAGLARAISNLLDNATKYWPDGGTIGVSLSTHNGRTELRVEDHGIGIPPGKLETIFEPFERAVDDPRMPGTGIGLFSARRIARAHGGDLTVESRLGVGSTFTLTMPCAPADGKSQGPGGEAQ